MTARVAEQLADARGADARVHLDEVRSAGEQEGDFRFARDRFREQRLAGAGRSDEQHALRDAAADGGEALRLAQEVDDLLHFFFRLVDAGDVGERHGALRRIGFARLALERRNAARRHAIERETEHGDEAHAKHERDDEENDQRGGANPEGAAGPLASEHVDPPIRAERQSPRGGRYRARGVSLWSVIGISAGDAETWRNSTRPRSDCKRKCLKNLPHLYASGAPDGSTNIGVATSIGPTCRKAGGWSTTPSVSIRLRSTTPSIGCPTPRR